MSETNSKDRKLPLKYSQRITAYIRDGIIDKLTKLKEQHYPDYNKSRFISLLIEKGLEAFEKEIQDKES